MIHLYYSRETGCPVDHNPGIVVALCIPASVIAEALYISSDQALTGMEGMVYLTAAEQKVGLYIGKLQWEFGLYTLLKDASDFLEQEGAIESSPPWPAFRRSINPWYVEEIYRHLKRPKY